MNFNKITNLNTQAVEILNAVTHSDELTDTELDLISGGKACCCKKKPKCCNKVIPI